MRYRHYNNPYSDNRFSPEENEQGHVHEYLGSTKLAEEGDDRHNHRFAGVTGKPMYISNGNHRHELFTNTDFFDNHHHMLDNFTGPAIPVSEGKHVHFVRTRTTENDEHFHQAIFATLIENPLIG